MYKKQEMNLSFLKKIAKIFAKSRNFYINQIFYPSYPRVPPLVFLNLNYFFLKLVKFELIFPTPPRARMIAFYLPVNPNPTPTTTQPQPSVWSRAFLRQNIWLSWYFFKNKLIKLLSPQIRQVSPIFINFCPIKLRFFQINQDFSQIYQVVFPN